ncbi:MAG: hypothetical protein ACHQIM_11880 [Sphingobacteriales bacterium]
MKTLLCNKNSCLLIAVMLFLLITGCNPLGNDTNKCGPCPMYMMMEPNLNFRVVDKTNKQDLFFGSGAPYKISQLVMRHIVNGVPDTALLRVDTINHIFNVLVPPSHTVDTVTMQIAGLPKDVLLFETATVGKCCPRLMLNSVLYNGAVVFTAANGPQVAVLEK